jgi:MADS-box transcription factor
MDDDDDDDESGMSHHGSVERQMMPPQFQNQIASQHVHYKPSASPPISNGEFSHHQPRQRQITPRPHSGPASRALSRNGLQRTQPSSNLVPQGPYRPPLQNLYAYMPDLEIYDPHNGSNMQGASIKIPPRSSYGQISQYLDCGPPQQNQAQLIDPDKHRKVSMPPPFPNHYYRVGLSQPNQNP